MMEFDTRDKKPKLYDLLILTGVLFIVYFWNMDQKLMEWAYRRVNQIFDRKKEDIRF